MRCLLARGYPEMLVGGIADVLHYGRRRDHLGTGFGSGVYFGVQLPEFESDFSESERDHRDLLEHCLERESAHHTLAVFARLQHQVMMGRRDRD